MKRKPSAEATAAWIRLVRIQSRVLGAVEQDLKKAGFPPLSWYDALLELSRAPCGALRPVELEKQMLLPQYGLSRLIDRLVDNGLVARKVCEVDKRGLVVEITEQGRELQKKMWNAYSSRDRAPYRLEDLRRRCGEAFGAARSARRVVRRRVGASARKVRLTAMCLSHTGPARCCAFRCCPIRPCVYNVPPLPVRVFHGA